MKLLTVPLDVNMISETVDFFRNLGFSESDVKAVEQDLLQQQSKVMSQLKCQAMAKED